MRPLAGFEGNFQRNQRPESVSPCEVNDLEIPEVYKLFPFLIRQVVIEDLTPYQLYGFAFILIKGRKNLFEILSHLAIVRGKDLVIHSDTRRGFQAIQKVVGSGTGIADNDKPLVDLMPEHPVIRSLQRARVGGIQPVTQL